MLARVYEATWGRLFAAVYDLGMRATERAGLRDRRRALLAQARGATLELGAGTGANLSLYPPAVTDLVLAEPSPHMAQTLRARVAGGDRRAEVVAAWAESLPFDDASFDTVVCTLVLCTIGDPHRALAEAARVLRPGGRLLFIEHIRSADPRRARWQDRLERPWGVLAVGCHPNRDTLAAITASPLEIDEVEHGKMPKAAGIVEPMISGSARLPA
jgi:ubiquinone/menaquinone biosynthesis C-methylase UbiE